MRDLTERSAPFPISGTAERSSGGNDDERGEMKRGVNRSLCGCAARKLIFPTDRTTLLGDRRVTATSFLREKNTATGDSNPIV
ncbi:hypothetical protein BDZ89DRAFT_314247 [Hymenopellis radicata]|nr:hypothetical protein BDZ89DRAFT_314247 [Hymenopellis radicata]